jgi:hypothetical protein
LQDRQDNVVNIAETARLALFGVMKPSAPIDGDVRSVIAELASRRQGCSGVLLTEGKYVVKNWTIIRRAVLHDVVEVLIAP